MCNGTLQAEFALFTRNEMLQFAFDTFDEDKSGTIDPDEFGALMQVLEETNSRVGSPVFVFYVASFCVAPYACDVLLCRSLAATQNSL
jgi:hypothetical protein